jgi:hypothetical protein
VSRSGFWPCEPCPSARAISWRVWTTTATGRLAGRSAAAPTDPARFAVEGVVYGLADVLQAESPTFDRTRFLRSVFTPAGR